MMRLALFILAGLLAATPVSAQQKTWPDGWKDTAPHKTRFVEVETGVKLEVLDWGGSGRPLILLTGLGHTGHVFDDFAPKLKQDFHVYAITRRGYGDSTLTDGGYNADRLGDDVLAVIDALKLKRRPLLAGHSIGGQEVSSVASRYPDRIAGGVYLDGAYNYAVAWPKEGALYDVVHWQQDIDALQAKLTELEAQPGQPLPLVKEILATQLPKLKQDLEQWVLSRSLPPEPPPQITPAMLASWPAAMAAAKMLGDQAPEADWRLTHATPEGLPRFEHNTPKRVPDAMIAGKRSFTNIPVPVLAIYQGPKVVTETDPALRPAREARYAVDVALTERYRQNFLNAAPQGKAVFIAGADHSIYQSNPDDVIREIRAFAAGLPK